MDPNKDNPQDPTPPDSPSPPEPVEQTALEALDAGLAEASDAPPADPEPAPDAPPADAPADPEPKPDEPPPAVDDAKPDVGKEIADLGLKERSASRFREMSDEIRDFHKVLADAGIQDAKSIPELAQRAKYGEDMVAMVMDTGADAEHFGQALDFLKLDAAAVRGDKQAAKQAFDILSQQLAGYGRMLGIDVPNVVDPLSEHPDLAKEVEAGELPRARALELAGIRNQEAHATQRTQAQTEGQQRAEQAIQAGRAALARWDDLMRASDAGYEAKRDALSAKVEHIRATKPPSEWLLETQLAYAALPNPQPVVEAAPVVKPVPGPVRGARSTPTMIPDFATPEEALDFGIANAR